MWYMARCLDCDLIITRSFESFDEREGWKGLHIDVTGHRIESWEE